MKSSLLCTSYILLVYAKALITAFDIGGHYGLNFALPQIDVLKLSQSFQM